MSVSLSDRKQRVKWRALHAVQSIIAYRQTVGSCTKRRSPSRSPRNDRQSNCPILLRRTSTPPLAFIHLEEEEEDRKATFFAAYPPILFCMRTISTSSAPLPSPPPFPAAFTVVASRDWAKSVGSCPYIIEKEFCRRACGLIDR